MEGKKYPHFDEASKFKSDQIESQAIQVISRMSVLFSSTGSISDSSLVLLLAALERNAYDGLEELINTEASTAATASIVENFGLGRERGKKGYKEGKKKRKKRKSARSKAHTHSLPVLN